MGVKSDSSGTTNIVPKTSASRRGLYSTVSWLSALASVSLVTPAALAQTAQPIAAAASTPDEIIVTARKREENLQDIPVSGSVITEQELLDIGGLKNENDIGALLPGVVIDTFGNAEFFIRGAGTGATPFTASVVTQFRNGAEVAGGFGGRTFERMDLFDVRQSELYRGAQGALYGRNAVGGVINLVNNDPKAIKEYRLLGSYDFTQSETRLEAIYNTPIVEDRVFLRAGIASQNGDGFSTNAFQNGEPVNALEFWGARIALKAFLSEKADATFTVDYGDTHFDSLLAGPSLVTIPNGATYQVFDDPRGVDGLPLPGDSAANDVTAANPLLVGFPSGNPGNAFRQAFDTPGYADEDTVTANLRVNFELPFAVAQSITGYRHRTFDLEFDIDGGYVGGPLRGFAPATTAVGANCGYYVGANHSRITGPVNIAGANVGVLATNAAGQFIITGGRPSTAADLRDAGQCKQVNDTVTEIFTQEFRIVSNSDGPLSWLLGADYRHFSNPVDQLSIGRNPSVASVLNGTVLRPLPANNLGFETETSQVGYGAYGTFGYDVTSWFNIAASVRYSIEDVDFSNVVTDLDFVRGFASTAVVPTTRGNVAGGTFISNRDFGQVIQRVKESESFESIIPSVYATVSHNDLTLYAAYGEGFRAGGFNRVSGTAVVQGANLTIPLQYDEESAKTYGVGVKRTFKSENGFNLDLSAALFHTDYFDLIQSVNATTLSSDQDDLNSDQFTDLVAYNLGDAWIHGVEIDFRGRIPDFLWTGGRLDFSGGVTFNESEATSGPTRGNEINFVNTWTTNANLTYRRELPGLGGDAITYFLTTNFVNQVDTDNALNARGRDTVRIANASTGLEGTVGNHKWQGALFADNVFDVQYERERPSIFGVNAAQYNNPVAVGVRFTVASAGQK